MSVKVIFKLHLREKPAPAPLQHPVFGPVISSYSRAQAIVDGVLVDLGMFVSDGHPVLNLVGIRFPVAMTSTAYAAVIGERDGELLPTEVVTKRVLYLLSVLKRAIIMHPGSDLSLISFGCTSAQLKPIELKAIFGPGDRAEPVITIMLPLED